MIPYVRDIKFEYGQVDQVSPLIRRVIADNPGPFTYKGTGTYIIGTGDGLAVIDPGPDLPAHLQAILGATAGERISQMRGRSVTSFKRLEMGRTCSIPVFARTKSASSADRHVPLIVSRASSRGGR